MTRDDWKVRELGTHYSGGRVLRNTLVQAKAAEVMLYEMEQRALDAGWKRDALGLVSPDGKSRLDR